MTIWCQNWLQTYTRENHAKKKKREMQQMMECLLKEIRASQKDFLSKMEANRKKENDEMEADHKELLARLEDDRQAKRRFMKEMMQMMDTSYKEIMAEIKPGRNMETIACQEMEAHPEEEKPASVDMKSEAAEREVPVQDATVMPVREPEEETTSITRKETMACQETEARLEEREPTSVETKPEVAPTLRSPH
jgi:hypothetical protein